MRTFNIGFLVVLTSCIATIGATSIGNRLFGDIPAYVALQ